MQHIYTPHRPHVYLSAVLDTSTVIACRKRRFISLQDKARLINEASSSKKKTEIAVNFDITQSMLSLILNFKDATFKDLSLGTPVIHNKLTQPAHGGLEKALYMWFPDMWTRKMLISGSMLQQKVPACA